MTTKIFLTIAAVFFFAQAMAQRDTAFVYTRNGQPVSIHAKIFDNANQVQNYHGQFPLYVFPREVAQSAFYFLGSVIDNERNLARDLDNYKGTEAIYVKLDSLSTRFDSLTHLRMQNFKDAYDSMMVVNKKYDDNLQQLSKIANDLNKKRSHTGTWLGILGGLAAGILLGSAIK